MFELAAGAAAGAGGADFFRGSRFDLGGSGAPSPSSLVALSPPRRDLFSLSLAIPTCPSLFFSSRTSVIDCSIPSVLSVGVADSLFFPRPALEPESILSLRHFETSNPKHALLFWILHFKS